MTHNPEYDVWKQMHYRCKNPQHKSFPYYGGRGIDVCVRWNSFDNFIADMGRRPPGPPHHWTIDRSDNDGNYEPGNCRWITKAEQALNRRKRSMNKKGKKITLEKANAIRSDPRSQRVIAVDYGVSQRLVWLIKHEQAWVWP